MDPISRDDFRRCQYKILISIYSSSHYIDEMVVETAYLYDDDSYTGQTTVWLKQVEGPVSVYTVYTYECHIYQ